MQHKQTTYQQPGSRRKASPLLSALVTISLVLLVTATSTAQQLRWQQVAPGVWKGTAGQPQHYDLLKAAGAKPAEAALALLGEAAFPLDTAAIQAEILDQKTYLRLPLAKNEQIYGLGLGFKTVQQRGRILNLHVDHYGGTDNGRTHAPVPFYVSSAGYGVLINSARYLTVYAGTAVRSTDLSERQLTEKNRNEDKDWQARPYSDAVEILIPDSGVECYVFAGPTALKAVQRYNLFNGGGALPPRWGLGFTQRVKTRFTADQVKAEVDSFAIKGYPLDFIGLEPGWQSRAYPGTFSWDENRFPDPKGFVSDLRRRHVRVNLWINPYVSSYASFYKKIQPYSASHLVWQGLVPDFTMDSARKIFFHQLQTSQVDLGVSGYKIDEVDGYDYYLWPDVARFPGGLAAEQMRQTYAVLAMRYSLEMFREKNLRTYGLVRASNAGANSFPYVLYNDYYNHADFITALINSGFIGVLWTPEVRSSATAEEWLRRFQTAIFSPMAMINAWSTGTKPWTYPEVADEVRELALLRMQMMPYWYTQFARYHFQGIPVFRAMHLEPGFSEPLSGNAAAAAKGDLDRNPYQEAVAHEIKDQYMAGASLLVAPLFAGQLSRKVILPEGKWYDFYTGEYAGGGQVITVRPGLDRIPVYVKNGGMIPMTAASLHAPAPGERQDLEIRVYGDTTGRTEIYDDDGLTLDYEKGEYEWIPVEVIRDGSGQRMGRVLPSKRSAKGQDHYTYRRIRFRWMTPDQ